MSTSTLKVADTAAEFTSAKDGVQKASKSIKEARRETRGVARSDQRVTRLESTATRLTRELKDLGDRFNAATDPELKESLTGKIVAINAKIIAFNTDVNTQLQQLREDVGQNTDDIAVEKGRNDGQDRQLEMLSEGQQSLHERVSSIATYGFARMPRWQIVVSIVVGFIAGVIWNNHSFGDSFTATDGQVFNVPYGPANSVWAAIGAGFVAALIALVIFSFFQNDRSTAQATTHTEETIAVPRPSVIRRSVRTAAPTTEPQPDPTPTQVITTNEGAEVGARS